MSVCPVSPMRDLSAFGLCFYRLSVFFLIVRAGSILSCGFKHLTNTFRKWLEGIEYTEESREVPFLSVVMYVKTLDNFRYITH